MTSTFKEIFFTLAKHLGEDETSIINQLGTYDEKDQNEHRTYIWFSDVKASFHIANDDTIKWVSAPLADVYGHPYFSNQDFFSIDGLRQGMSKMEVLFLWGPPDWKANRVWGYKEKGDTTKNGKRFELCVEFAENNDLYTLSHFEA